MVPVSSVRFEVAAALLARRSRHSVDVPQRDVARLGLDAETIASLVQAMLLEPAPDGFRIAKSSWLCPDGRVDWPALAAVVIESGLFEESFRRLLDLGTMPSFRMATRVAAPAAAIVSWNPAWRNGDRLAVPVELIERSLAEGSLDVVPTRPDWLEAREEVGARAEAYTLRRLRQLHGVRGVIHASKEIGDYLGYDIEVVQAPRTYVDAKGSRGTTLVVVVSETERRTAERYRGSYEIHFWGDIDVSRPRREEYQRLLGQGWPTVLIDPISMLETGTLRASCTAWTVRWQDGVVEENDP